MVRSRAGKNISVILLGLYGLVCLAVFTWVRFPYDALGTRIENGLGAFLGVPVRLGHIRPTWTGGFSVQGVELQGNLIVKTLRLTPYPWEALRGVVGLGYRAEMPAGSLEGRVALPTRMSSRPMDISLELNEVDLSGISAVFPPSWRPAGLVTGEVRMASPKGALDKMMGSMSISWEKGRLPLGMPSLPFDALVFETMELEGTVEKGIVKIDRGEFTGEFSGNLTGMVRLLKDMRRSRLNLTGEVSLPEAVRASLGAGSPPQGQPARFSLRGTMERPRFRIVGLTQPGGAPARPAVAGASQGQVSAAALRRESERSRIRAGAEVTAPPDAGVGPGEQALDQADGEGFDMEGE